jgi:hypothetical protein
MTRHGNDVGTTQRGTKGTSCSAGRHYGLAVKHNTSTEENFHAVLARWHDDSLACHRARANPPSRMGGREGRWPPRRWEGRGGRLVAELGRTLLKLCHARCSSPGRPMMAVRAPPPLVIPLRLELPHGHAWNSPPPIAPPHRHAMEAGPQI